MQCEIGYGPELINMKSNFSNNFSIVSIPFFPIFSVSGNAKIV